jgi:uncharacterized surface protein with fasciclin (FAS1) repeats
VTRIRLRRLAATAALVLAVAACGANTGGTNAPGARHTDSGQSATPGQSVLPMSGDEFGPLCADLPAPVESGSLDAMTRLPVATAVAGSGMLATLSASLAKAGLGATLDGLGSATVFAPTDNAFGKMSKSQLEALTSDPARLRAVLLYHVVPDRRVASDELTAAPLTTLQKGTLRVTGSGEDFTVNGSAHVVCGNVQTTNATVYLIDSVLIPPPASTTPSPSAS